MSSISKIQIDNNEKILISSLMTEKTSPFKVTNPIGEVISDTIIKEGDRVEDLLKQILTEPNKPIVTITVDNETVNLMTDDEKTVLLQINIKNVVEAIKSVKIINNGTILSTSTVNNIELYSDKECKIKATTLDNGIYYYLINIAQFPIANIDVVLQNQLLTTTSSIKIKIVYPAFFGYVNNTSKKDEAVQFYCFSNGQSIIYTKNTSTLEDGLDFYFTENQIIFTLGGQLKKSTTTDKYYTIQDSQQYQFANTNLQKKVITTTEKKSGVDPVVARTVTEYDLNNCIITDINALPFESNSISFAQKCPFFAYPAKLNELFSIIMNYEIFNLFDKTTFNVQYDKDTKQYSIANQDSETTVGVPYICYIKHDYFTADEPIKFIFK